MGLNTEHVLSDERHYNPFICAICTNLVELKDVLVTVKCSHAFCRHCIETWLGLVTQNNNENSFRNDRLRCPTCNQSLEKRHGDSIYDADVLVTQIAAVQKLKVAQPLAYRVLSRVHVSCPLADVGCCQWKGDYADLQQHLLSDTQHMNSDITSKHSSSDGSEHISSSNDVLRIRRMVTSYKEEANRKFSAENFEEALELYSKALSFISSLVEEDVNMVAALYSNRAAAYTKLKQYNLCIKDCNEAIRLDPMYVKAFIRRSKAQLELGKFDDALNSISEGTELNKESQSFRDEFNRTKHIRDQMKSGLSYLQNNEFIPAAKIFGSMLQNTSSLPVIIAAARAEIGLGFTDRAMRLTLQIIRADKSCAEGYEVRALCFFMIGELADSIKLFREALRLDPDSKAKYDLKMCLVVKRNLDDANKFVFHRKFSEAIDKFSFVLKQLKSFPSNSYLICTIHSKLAEAYLRTKQFKLALEHSSTALCARNDLESAWLVKVQAYRGLGQEEAALNELEVLMETWGSSSDAIRNAYNTPYFHVRKKKRPDYYKLFNVPRVSSEMEIKRQYKVRAKELHPDRFCGSKYSESVKKDAEEKFKLLGEGLEILCDDFKRQLYDEGYDRKAILERVEAAQRAAHRSPHNYHHH